MTGIANIIKEEQILTKYLLVWKKWCCNDHYRWEDGWLHKYSPKKYLNSFQRNLKL